MLICIITYSITLILVPEILSNLGPFYIVMKSMGSGWPMHSRYTLMSYQQNLQLGPYIEMATMERLRVV